MFIFLIFAFPILYAAASFGPFVLGAALGLLLIPFCCLFLTLPPSKPLTKAEMEKLMLR
jgi:hypothetical protein